MQHAGDAAERKSSAMAGANMLLLSIPDLTAKHAV